MSCTYKPYNIDTDGPSSLYHQMNRIDCALKKFGGTLRRKRKLKRKTKGKSRKYRRSKR